MKSTHLFGIALVAVFSSAAAFGADAPAGTAAEETVVTAAPEPDPAIEEIVVIARRPAKLEETIAAPPPVNVLEDLGRPSELEEHIASELEVTLSL
ncbi:MAG TPA: hypothetical protein VF329_11845 [Gammaproteobacteria bacterium]